MNDRSPIPVFIGLGSNLADPMEQVNQAVTRLSQLPDSQLVRTSPWYQSTAVGPGEQPDYVNGVVLLHTRLSPRALFAHTQQIELDQGRQRRVRWAARTLDLDILLYGDQVIDTADLQIPHPRLTERNFVIYPLADLQANLRLPNGVAIASLLAQTAATGLTRLDT